MTLAYSWGLKIHSLSPAVRRSSGCCSFHSSATSWCAQNFPAEGFSIRFAGCLRRFPVFFPALDFSGCSWGLRSLDPFTVLFSSSSSPRCGGHHFGHTNSKGELRSIGGRIGRGLADVRRGLLENLLQGRVAANGSNNRFGGSNKIHVCRAASLQYHSTGDFRDPAVVAARSRSNCGGLP